MLISLAESPYNSRCALLSVTKCQKPEPLSNGIQGSSEFNASHQDVSPPQELGKLTSLIFQNCGQSGLLLNIWGAEWMYAHLGCKEVERK